MAEEIIAEGGVPKTAAAREHIGFPLSEANALVIAIHELAERMGASGESDASSARAITVMAEKAARHIDIGYMAIESGPGLGNFKENFEILAGVRHG